MNKLEVGMYVRGKYYSYKGKIGKIIKNYNGDLEIAYKDSIVKTTVSSFIDDNFDINGKQYVASHNIIDLIKPKDIILGKDGKLYQCWKVYKDYVFTYSKNKQGQTITLVDYQIDRVMCYEQFESMSYKLGDNK